jgi:hypothetical protein
MPWKTRFQEHHMLWIAENNDYNYYSPCLVLEKAGRKWEEKKEFSKLRKRKFSNSLLSLFS